MINDVSNITTAKIGNDPNKNAVYTKQTMRGPMVSVYSQHILDNILEIPLHFAKCITLLNLFYYS